MGRLDNILENNILNLDDVAEPFAGMQTGFGRQKELSQKINNRTLIAGRGIILTQTAQGIIVEASNITEKHEHFPAPMMYIAKVKSNTNGVILADLYLNGLLDDEAIYAKDVQIFSTINNTWQRGLEAGDCILATPVTTLTAGVLEEDNESEA